MTLYDLPTILAGRGVRLAAKLAIDAPKGTLDPALRAALSRFRPELLEALVRAERLGIGAVRYADVLMIDTEGFDWSTGIHRGNPAP
jgi:hypothetical protein